MYARIDRKVRRRGQTAVVVAGALVFAVIVIGTIRHFVARPAPVEPPRPVYLSDERTAVDTNRGMASATPWAATGRTVFSRSFAERVFGPGAGSDGDGPHRSKLGNLGGDSAVLVRLFDTPDGDFLYHTEHGWLHFADGAWHPMAIRDLPTDIRTLYPRFCHEQRRTSGRSF